MKVIAIGDTHLLHGHWRDADRLAAMEQIVGEGLQLPDLGAWIHLGDIWHAKPTDKDLEVVADFFQRMAERAPVLALIGNHGAVGYSLLMRRLKAKWPIVVVDTPQVLHVDTAVGGTLHLAALPYPQKGQLVATGVAPGEIGRAAGVALDAICLCLAEELRHCEGPKLLIGHATIAGATASTGQPLGIEHDIAVSATMLARFGPDVVKVFGHIHKPHEVHGAHYAGSISANDWGETEHKRYVVVQYDGQTTEVLSQPIETPRLYHVEGELTRDDFAWRCTKGPGGPTDEQPFAECSACGGGGQVELGHHVVTRDMAIDAQEPQLEGMDMGPEFGACENCGGGGRVIDWNGCYVRVRYRYHAAERELLGDATARIEREFAGALRVDVEPVAITQREARAPEVVSATTLPEKLQAWARLTNTSWSGEIGPCADRLLASEDGEAVVSETAARLEALLCSKETAAAAQYEREELGTR